MPWTPKSFADRHNQNLSKPEAKQAAKVADAILRDTGDEGKAIRIECSSETEAVPGASMTVFGSAIAKLPLVPAVGIHEITLPSASAAFISGSFMVSV